MPNSMRHARSAVGAPRTFDHTALARYPEYLAVRRAIDSLGRALDRNDSDFNRAAFVDAVADMARTSYASDWCDCCRDRFDLDPSCWPYAGTVSRSGLTGTYRCPRTGRTWGCFYASPEVWGAL